MKNGNGNPNGNGNGHISTTDGGIISNGGGSTIGVRILFFIIILNMLLRTV